MRVGDAVRSGEAIALVARIKGGVSGEVIVGIILARRWRGVELATAGVASDALDAWGTGSQGGKDGDSKPRQRNPNTLL